MKINEIIREKRKEQSLTQEQVAEYLGVSTPAVNKWEKGITYPDITILPALARLLKVDLNTLLSFDEDLSQLEITNFINEISMMIQKEGYDKGFKEAMEKIQQYPSSESLIISVALTLHGSLTIFAPENKEDYEAEIEKLYLRASCSDNAEIKDRANSMLISKYIGQEEYDKAQALVDTLPNPSVDKNQIQSHLYLKQERYQEALQILEGKMLKAANEIQSILLCIMDIAIKENRNDDAEYYAEVSEKTVSLYDLWRYNSHVAKFQLATSQKNVDKCIKILDEMLYSMKHSNEISNSKLYKHLKTKSMNESFSNMLIQNFIKQLENDEEMKFLIEEPKILKILDRYRTQ